MIFVQFIMIIVQLLVCAILSGGTTPRPCSKNDKHSNECKRLCLEIEHTQVWTCTKGKCYCGTEGRLYLPQINPPDCATRCRKLCGRKWSFGSCTTGRCICYQTCKADYHCNGYCRKLNLMGNFKSAQCDPDDGLCVCNITDQ